MDSVVSKSGLYRARRSSKASEWFIYKGDEIIARMEGVNLVFGPMRFTRSDILSVVALYLECLSLVSIDV